jgi:hypothetical protein
MFAPGNPGNDRFQNCSLLTLEGCHHFFRESLMNAGVLLRLRKLRE